MKSSKCISDIYFYRPFIWCCQCQRVLTLTLWLDIINYIWIKLWFGISPDEDSGVLDKRYISVHRWFCFLWSDCSPRVVPRLRVSAPPVLVRNADSQDLCHISGIRNRVGPSHLCFIKCLGDASAHSGLPLWEVMNHGHENIPGFPTSRPTAPPLCPSPVWLSRSSSRSVG